MLFPQCSVWSLLATCAAAQRQYGYNHREVNKDSAAASQFFLDINDVELLSPAFLNPETVPPGFANNTDGPTDQKLLGTPH